MSIYQKIRSNLQKDPLLQRVVRNSSYLFSSSAISAMLGLVQGILVVRMLGDSTYGLLAIIMDFASNTNRLLSFRMSEVVVKYVGEAMAQGNKQAAAALVKGIGMSEAVTSLLAYLVLLAISSWGAKLFANDATAAYLFRYYGLFLLANLVYETTTGVLQTTNQFKRVAHANFYQSVVITFLIVAAAIFDLGLLGVLAAYLIGKTVAALMIAGSALQQLSKKLGKDWIHAPLRLVDNWKSILRFALSTNLNGTVNLFARDNIRLYLAVFLPDAQIGYFKLASQLINLVMLPIEPFIAPTYAEIARTIAQHQWQKTRTLLRQVSTIGGVWTLFAGGGLIALGWWLIPRLYGSNMLPAYFGVIILLIGYGFANVMNWNRPLLLALGYPAYPLMVAAITGAIEVILIFIFVPGRNYLVGAAIFSAYLAVSISWNVIRGLSILKRKEATT